MSGQYTREYLAELQGYPLSMKLALTRQRIREWIHRYGTDGVYVSFSGGKDSTVLLHIVREMYPDVKAVFVDTGLEYPEIRQFVRTFDNVDWFKPKKNFRQVIQDYGYPFISKEVSESAAGARRYLTEILAENSVDRQTDRQYPYSYFYRRITGTGEYAKPVKIIKGGADNKYRKLAGIGEYSKRSNGQQKGRRKSTTGNNARNADNGQGTPSAGEYP